MELFLALILGAVAIALAMHALRRGAPPETPLDLPDDPPVRLQGRRWCDFEIAGESHYQAALEAIAGHEPQGVNLHCAALLVPEPDNHSDPNAVAVVIEGRRVGYLRREDAAGYGARLAALGVEGRPAACPAYVCGGFITEDGDLIPYGVTLGLAWPAELEAKVTAPPMSPVVRARLGGAPLSEEEAWHTPPVPPADAMEFKRLLSGGFEQHAVCFAGWSEARMDYLAAVARSVGLGVRGTVTEDLTLMCVGPAPPDEDVERARSQGVTLISGDQLQELVARIASETA
ncbi:MAG: hypothetical protein JWP28_2617 [Phenylobacterium sp.]|uniref:hypothetical protein n=1 Tax=Phenylobacterium sp. TaxID=1871053 RepID=UPI002608FE46|nr:hypothetical protein [Phenylobacterium sp.]MDB5498586.1 hypothetical protein [Phenylobacterium sp.]